MASTGPAPEGSARRLATVVTPRLALLVAGLGVIVVFVGFLLASTEGHFVPPVVDLYLVCQYAKALAEGHPFQYNAGEPASTGATSLLHTVLLAVGHAAGARGEGLIAWAMALGAAFFLATIFLAHRVGGALAGPRAGVLAGGLVALNGPVAWGFLYGSDIALFMLLGTWLLDRLVDAESASGRAAGVALVGSLIALARPEGLPIAVLLAWLAVKSRRTGRDLATSLIPLLAASAVLVLYKALTGSWLGTSVADKSLFANYGWISGLALSAQYGVDVIRGLLLGFYSSETAIGFSRGWAPFFFPPLGLLLVLYFAGSAGAPERRAALRWLLIVAATWVLVIPNTFMGVHFNRYLMWAFPGLLCLMACGLDRLARRAAGGNERVERHLFSLGAALAVAVGLGSVVRFAGLFAEGSGEVWRRDVATARFISTHLPRGIAMANVATSVEYLTGHRNLNLHGVTSAAFFGNRTAEREAGLFESLGRLPREERPAFLLSSEATQAGSPLLRALAPAPPLFQSTSLADELQVLRIDYALVGKSPNLYSAGARAAAQGLSEVDRLNVCDSRDEKAHGYERSTRLGNLGLEGTVRIDSYPAAGEQTVETVADAGRVILGHETFAIRTRPGRDLVVVMRTAAAAQVGVLRASGGGLHELALPEAGLTVLVDGQVAAQVAFRPPPGWSEQSFRVPGRFLRESSARLRLQGRYASFHYWFFQ